MGEPRVLGSAVQVNVKTSSVSGVSGRREAWFVGFADFCDVSTPTIPDVSLRVMSLNVESGSDVQQHTIR